MFVYSANQWIIHDCLFPHLFYSQGSWRTSRWGPECHAVDVAYARAGHLFFMDNFRMFFPRLFISVPRFSLFVWLEFLFVLGARGMDTIIFSIIYNSWTSQPLTSHLFGTFIHAVDYLKETVHDTFRFIRCCFAVLLLPFVVILFVPFVALASLVIN